MSAPSLPDRSTLLARHQLCAITGLHDVGPDGRCRDCTKPLTDADPVCRSEPTGPTVSPWRIP